MRRFATTLGWAWLALACSGIACSSGGTLRADDATGVSRRRMLDGSRFTFVEAECSDGRLELGELGYENELSLSVTESGLLLSEDISLAAEGCAATHVWAAEPQGVGDHWRFETETEVLLPPSTQCGARRDEPTEGTLRTEGDLLEVVVFRSPWCRGFDARFVFRRAAPERLSAQQIVTRYVAHWNRRDAEAMTELFADSGSLIEPFSATDDGNYKRHEGREAIRDWYEDAFYSTPWLAMRLLGLDSAAQGDEAAARWEYMDARLERPFIGRNLFVIAGGEIFETEVQLISDPEPGVPEATETSEGGAVEGEAQ